MTVVKCTLEMASEICRIEKECFSDPWSRESIEWEIAAGRVLCVCDGAVLGYIVSWSVADECEIANIAVAPEYRRRGVADMLLRHVMSDTDMKYFLEVREGNTAARNLYVKHGFCEYGRRKNYYKKPTEDAILYKKC